MSHTSPRVDASPPVFVAVTGVLLIGYNSVVHLTPGYANLYVPLNLAMAAALYLAARRSGLDTADLGLERKALGSGLRWGAAVGFIAGGGLAIAVAVPGLHGLLDDERIAGIGIGLLAYRVLLRIPFGTVVLEELAFRGVLFGAWARWKGTLHATIGTSVLFGLWHIRPAIELLDINEIAEPVPARIAAVAGMVMLTAGAGVFFCLLRVRSRSLVAPMVAHAAINSLATIAAYIVR